MFTSRTARLLIAGVLAAAAATTLTQAADAHPTYPPKVPDAVKVLPGNEQFLAGHAFGVQIYSCNATATGPAWTFVAPRANLFDDRGRLIITHFAGPTWQARDGSQVVGRVDGIATVDPKAIPWLRLAAASTTPGQLGNTTFIQRINTEGGVAPAASRCNARTVGARAEVPYAADYTFWRQKKGGHDHPWPE